MTLALIAIFAMSTGAMAQNDNDNRQRRFDPKEMVQHQTDRMAERYELTDEQAEKVLVLNTEYAGKLRPMNAQGRGPRTRDAQPPKNDQIDGHTGATEPNREEMQARMNKMKEQQQAYDNALKDILTEEQFQKYEADQKQMQQRGPRDGRRGPRGPRQQR